MLAAIEVPIVVELGLAQIGKNADLENVERKKPLQHSRDTRGSGKRPSGVSDLWEAVNPGIRSSGLMGSVWDEGKLGTSFLFLGGGPP